MRGEPRQPPHGLSSERFFRSKAGIALGKAEDDRPEDRAAFGVPGDVFR